MEEFLLNNGKYKRVVGLVTDQEGNVGILLRDIIADRIGSVLFEKGEVEISDILDNYEPLAVSPLKEEDLTRRSFNAPVVIMAFYKWWDATLVLAFHGPLESLTNNSAKGIIALGTEESTLAIKDWKCTEPMAWREAFNIFVTTVAEASKDVKESIMFKESAIPPRNISVDKADENDPMQIQAQAAKEIIESFFNHGDFTLSMNLEGRTLEDGHRELVGAFTFTIKEGNQ